MAKLLKRRKVVQTLLAERGDLLVIGGLGAPAW
nr:aldehyde dehydrogenase [Betaproteobacteria bacterium]